MLITDVGTVVDLAFTCLNPAAQLLLRRPARRYLWAYGQHFLQSLANGDFARPRHALPA